MLILVVCGSYEANVFSTSIRSSGTIAVWMFGCNILVLKRIKEAERQINRPVECTARVSVLRGFDALREVLECAIEVIQERPLRVFPTRQGFYRGKRYAKFAHYGLGMVESDSNHVWDEFRGLGIGFCGKLPLRLNGGQSHDDPSFHVLEVEKSLNYWPTGSSILVQKWT
jgi:hypothetical protein